MTTMGPDYVFQNCYVNISLYNEKLELFVSVALLLAGTVYVCGQKKNLNRTLEIDSPFQTLTVGLLVEFID